MMSFIFVVTILAIQFRLESASALGDPPFHMMPLGSHAQSGGVDELAADNMITPKAFARDYIYAQKPLVLRGMASKWPAFSLWTDEYLKDTFGSMELRLVGKRGKLSKIPQGDVSLGRDSMTHFIKTYHNPENDKQVLSELPTPMYKDVNIPPPLGCGDLSKSFVEIDMWLNSGGTHTNLHKHKLNSITCAVNGSKTWQLIDMKYDEYLYQFWENTHDDDPGYGGFSLVDPEKVDMKRFPDIAKIEEWYSTTVNAGDCLFLPYSMWHVAYSKGDQNLAIAFLFERLDNKNLADLALGDCADHPSALPLEKVDPDWQYSGSGRMSFGNNEISYYLDVMDGFFGKLDDKLNHDLVTKVLAHMHSHMPYSELHSVDRADELYDKLSALCGKRVCTSKILKKITRNRLRKFINNYIQAIVPGNCYEHEYALFSADQVGGLFEDIAKKNKGLVTQSQFIEAYVTLGGHSKIAKSVWKSAAGKKESINLEKHHNRMIDACSKFHLYDLEDLNHEHYGEIPHEHVEAEQQGKQDQSTEQLDLEDHPFPELAPEELSDSVVEHYENHHDEL